MANSKSAKARILVGERNRVRNNTMRSAIRTAIKGLIKANDSKAEATELETQKKNAFSLVDRAVLKGIVHKNTGARYKARIHRLAQAN